ncbi:MAG: hypothetical protein QOD03_94 [Verrucomicrobiota bacterium]
MKKTLSITIALVCVATARAQVAQVETVQERQQLKPVVKTQFNDGEAAPELYSGESDDVGPQSVLRPKARKTLFEVSGDAQLFRTDNLFLTDKDPFGVRDREKVEAVVLVSTVEIALAPTPYEIEGGKLAPRFGYRHQWFDFGLDDERLPGSRLPLSHFNFNAQTLFADAQWSRDNWVFSGGVNGMRLMTSDGYDQFYSELLPHLGVKRILPINEQMAFAFGYEGNYHFTSTKVEFFPFDASDVSDRTDQMLFATYTHVLCKHAVFQPYYRFKYTHFTESSIGERNDYLQSMGASLYFIICPHLNVRAFAGYDIKRTDNHLAAEYHKLDLGGGVNVTFRF